MKESATPQVRFAQVGSAQDVERHASFLQTTNVGEINTDQEIIPPKKGEEWEIIAEWDAIPELPKKSTRRFGGLLGYPEEHFWPRFITWNPNGRSLRISRDFGTLTAWTLSGERLGGKQIKETYGRVNRVYWSNDGSWVLIEGEPSFNSSVDCLWSVLARDGKSGCHFAPDYFRFGSSNPNRYSRNQPVPAFNPWRPYSSQFLKWNYKSRCFELFDMERSPSRIEGSAERYVSQAVDLASLPSDDQTVENFTWHPSGRYVAFVAEIYNRNTRGSVRRAHLLDWDSAQIIASTLPFVAEDHTAFRPFAVGWSPGGQWLVLDEEVSKVWDVRAAEVAALDIKQRELGWANRLNALRHAGMDSAWVSCDGERVLQRGQGESGEFDWEGTLIIKSTREGYLQELPSALTAAWSPTDPHCFATIARRLVRIWRLKGSPSPNT